MDERLYWIGYALVADDNTLYDGRVFNSYDRADMTLLLCRHESNLRIVRVTIVAANLTEDNEQNAKTIEPS